MTINQHAGIGGIHLRVSDLERSLAFYTHVIGFDLLSQDEGRAVLGAGDRPLLVLRELPGAVPRPRRTTGIYHFAILVPGRAALGHALARIAAARWPLQGASDHGVSEALYLGDPDGIGIEIYRDRDRTDWPVDGDGFAMVTEALDLRAVLDAAGTAEVEGRLPAGTRIGHVHLQVRDLADAERFYHGALGFDVMQRLAPSALFVSAGGYHHHVGLNTWGVAGAPAQPDTAPGLDYFELAVPTEAAVEDVRTGLAGQGVPMDRHENGWLARDPSGNAVLVRVG